MKKLLSILVVIAMMATLCTSAFAHHSLDAMYANVDSLQLKGGGVDSGLAAKSKVQIDFGDKLFILGWAIKDGANLEAIYWEVDGVEKECADVYRDRNDVAGSHLHIDASYGDHGGFGTDEEMMELLGADELPNGAYKARIFARFDDSEDEEIKAEFDLLVGPQGGEEETPVVYNDLPMDLEVELYVDVKTDGVEITENDDGSVLCETVSVSDPADPWISFQLDEIDTGIYTSVTISYEITGTLHGNNIYFKDTEKNPGYSPTLGTWTIPMMQGEPRTIVFDEDVTLMDDVDLTGIRIPGASLGGSILVKSITFHNPLGIGAERDFDKDKGDGLSFDQIMIDGTQAANGNDAVIALKKNIDGTAGNISSIALYGWYGNANSTTVAFGYKINDEDIVYGDFFIDTESDVTKLGANNRRFTIPIDVSALEGRNEIWVYARLANGDQVKLNRYEGTKDREIYVIYNGPGAVSVELGDVDGDGEITDWDAIVFERYLAGWDVEVNLDAMDLDNDEEVSDWDAIMLARYLAGWDVTFG
ncbi:MAG: dockerin type I repeat-containing protein [Clostridia bacterium]|nr:dockerin type I repeat-containing protein [Clostridia bacterium]